MKNLEFHIKNIGKDVPHQIKLIEKEISGGDISKSTIDRLQNTENKYVLTVSGLRQDTFEYLVSQYGKNFRTINFWKCPLVEDLSPIEDLTNVEYISYFWNQRATRLWDFKKTPKIKGFSFDDFTRMKSISDLEYAKNLEELEFGDKVWVKYKLETLDPIAKLVNLKNLNFSAKKIEDGRIEPLGSLAGLESLSFPSNLFTTEQVAWLKTKLPEAIEAKVLNPFWTIDKPIEIGGKNKNTFIVGKRKPFLDSVIDQKRIEKYTVGFEDRVRWFKNNPSKLPSDFA
ncbi:hypothetical protein [Microbulbifer sp. GL-2]|uniref:hypothetical protein n=1 Tax=Microbulbifer sp. GL-2 TaxID=2591606 RepID=UPI001165058F|nr:hypothetical protein [Microbulbifer sp. GL-2]BBM03995.1 internalin [Microbulbifer sp. GL-2]